MKKALIFILFFGSVLQSESQSWVYHPFPLDSAVWMQKVVYSDGVDHYYINEIMGDTIIGSFTYQKMYTSNWFNFPVYSTSLPVYYDGGIRQDIPNKKVYRLSASGLETLLYDFDLAIGDTVQIISMTNDTIYVSGTDSVLVGGVYHKSFILNNPVGSVGGFTPGELIEGVGNTSGLNSWYYQLFEGQNALLCFSERNIGQYPYGPWPLGCALTVGISDLVNEKIIVSAMPNPTSDAITLVVGCYNRYSIEVQNSLGEVLFSKGSLLSNESTIDFSTYSSGIYFVRLSDSKGNSVVKKIVKE